MLKLTYFIDEPETTNTKDHLENGRQKKRGELPGVYKDEIPNMLVERAW